MREVGQSVVCGVNSTRAGFGRARNEALVVMRQQVAEIG
jgi:hypothetical protein